MTTLADSMEMKELVEQLHDKPSEKTATRRQIGANLANSVETKEQLEQSQNKSYEETATALEEKLEPIWPISLKQKNKWNNRRTKETATGGEI